MVRGSAAAENGCVKKAMAAAKITALAAAASGYQRERLASLAAAAGGENGW